MSNNIKNVILSTKGEEIPIIYKIYHKDTSIILSISINKITII